MRTFIIISIFVLSCSPAFANTWVATVDGMVCAFCAKGIEDKLKKDPTVDTVTISLDDHTVTVASKPKTSVKRETIEKAVYYMDLTLQDLTEKP